MAAANAPIEESHAPHRTLDLMGHEAAEREVLDAWASGRMHHAWLLSGQRGIGKATLAYRIARFVLAQGNIDSGQGGGAPVYLATCCQHLSLLRRSICRRITQ